MNLNEACDLLNINIKDLDMKTLTKATIKARKELDYNNNEKISSANMVLKNYIKSGIEKIEDNINPVLKRLMETKPYVKYQNREIIKTKNVKINTKLNELKGQCIEVDGEYFYFPNINRDIVPLSTSFIYNTESGCIKIRLIK